MEIVDAERKTIAWRVEQLTRVGVPTDWAHEAAEEPHFDIYQVIELIKKGATPKQALDIVR